MAKHVPLLIAVLLLSTLNGITLASTNEAKPVTVAFTFSMPPYLIQKNSSGIERDIIYEAFVAADYQDIAVLNVHYLRAIELIKLNNIDVIVSNRSNPIYTNNIPNIETSDKTIDYVDCAITLSSRNFQLDNIRDYYDKSIWAFKSASEVLGKEFKQMAFANKHYSEDFDQLKQLDMLAMERIDIAISDRNIFTAKLQNSEKYKDLKFRFHNIGPVTPRVIRSTNKTLIKKFNKGLEMIKHNGKYKEILNSYQSRYANNCDV